MKQRTAALPEDDAVARHLDELRIVGWTCVPGLVAPEEADRLAEDIQRVEWDRGIRPENTPFSGALTWRVAPLLELGELYWHLPIDTMALQIAEHALGRDLRIYNYSSISIGAGEGAQPIHCDDQVMYRLPRPHDAVVCVAMWALTDFTAANGGTVVYPGSHRLPDLPAFDPHPPNPDGIEPTQVVAPKGSLIVWHGSLWHGAGPNRTAERRVALAVNYCRSFASIRPEQFLLDPLPDHLVDRFPTALQGLIGSAGERRRAFGRPG